MHSPDDTNSTTAKKEEAGESNPREDEAQGASDVNSCSADREENDPYQQLQYKSHFEFSLVEGVALPSSCSPELISKIRQFRVRDDDIWCLSYPKAGMHWLHEAMHMVYTRTPTHAPHDKEKYFLDFDNVQPVIEPLQQADSPRFINTHLLPRFLPEELMTSRAKIIYMYRNPKDTMISYYNHMTAFKTQGAKANELSISEYIDFLLHGYKRFGGYFGHMQQWSEQLSTILDRTLILSFEEMKGDPRGTLHKLAGFLGAPLSEAMCEKMLYELSIERTREACKARNPADNKSHILYRKGISGDWKQHFTVAQSERMDADTERQMTDVKLPLKLVYDTIH